MSNRKLKALIILGVVIGVTGLVMLWRMAVSRRIVETADGNTIRLAGYHFSTNKVPYELPHTVTEWWIAGLNLEPPDREEIVKPGIPGVPVLGAAFTFDQAPSSLRLVIADSAGRAFDPIVHDGSVGKRDWVTATSFFPRRGKRLQLRASSKRVMKGREYALFRSTGAIATLSPSI